MSTERRAAGHGFGKRVALVAVGNMVAQVVPLAASPVHTRLYTPNDFAALAGFLAVVGPLGAVASGRYEYAAMLPDESEEAFNVASAAVLVATTVSVASWFVLRLLRGHGPMARLGFLVWAIPLAVMLTCLWQILSVWVSRQLDFGRLSLGAIVQQTMVALTTIGLGVMLAGPWGLILGLLAGLGAGVLVLGARIWTHDRRLLAVVTRRGMLGALVKFRQFPLYKVPFSLLLYIGQNLTVIVLLWFHLDAAAGLLALARRLVFAPVTLAVSSVGQVHFQEAARSFGTPRLERLTTALLRVVVLLAPMFVFALWWAPDVFALAFGKPWRVAGEYARALGPLSFAMLLGCWTERFFEVARRQRLALGLQLFIEGSTFATLWLCLRHGVDPVRAVGAYSTLYGVLLCANIGLLFRVGGFRFVELASIAVLLGALVGATFAVVWALRALRPAPLVEFSAGLALALAFTGSAGLRAFRTFRLQTVQS